MPRRGLIGAILLAAIVLVAGLIVLGLAGDFLVDLLWFHEVGYVGVFWTVLAAKSAVFAVAFAGSDARADVAEFRRCGLATYEPFDLGR